MRKTSAQQSRREPSHHSDSIDMDPYSTSIIEELLNSPEWRNQDEIARLTFRALTDIIQVHSEAIKDLKSLISTRASKQQLTATMSLKANASDFSKMFEEMSAAMDSKVSFNEINSILKDYAHKKDLNEVLMKNSEIEEKTGKKTDRDFELKVMQARMDDFQKEMGRRLGTCITLPEFQELISIVEQKVNVSEMNQVLENRVTKQYLSTCLQKKISKSELDGLIAKKADAADLDFIISSLEMKASLPTIQKLTQIIENKADRSDLLVMTHEKKAFNEEINERIAQMRKQVQMIRFQARKQTDSSKLFFNQSVKIIERSNEDQLRDFVSSTQFTNFSTQIKKQVSDDLKKIKESLDSMEKEKSNVLKYDNFKRQLTNELNLRKRCEEKIYEEIDDVRKRIEEVAGKVLEKNEFFNFKSQLAEELDQKIETEHVQEAFNKWQVEISQKMQEDKEQIYTMLQRVQKTLTDSITQNSTDILSLSTNVGKKTQKIDQGVLEDMMRKNRREIEEFRKTIDVSYSELQRKIDISEYETDLLDMRKKFDQLERDINLKAYIKDVCVLADSKPNIEDVNKSLKEIKNILDCKTSEEDLQEVVQDQATINETLLCQNIIGRWLWQSGEVKPGGLIPWEVQFANTVPDYYFWDKDKSSILILVSGIYEITVGVFGRNLIPTLMINGDSISSLSKHEQNVNTMNLGSRKNSTMKKKREKDMVGQKVMEYLSLPARSRVSVMVGLEGGEGLLNIKRL